MVEYVPNAERSIAGLRPWPAWPQGSFLRILVDEVRELRTVLLRYGLTTLEGDDT